MEFFEEVGEYGGEVLLGEFFIVANQVDYSLYYVFLMRVLLDQHDDLLCVALQELVVALAALLKGLLSSGDSEVYWQ